MKENIEWQTENSLRDYPLENNSEFDTEYILDAIIYHDKATLLSIGRSELGSFVEIEVLVDEQQIVKFRTTGEEYYTYTDFGKIVWGRKAVEFMGKPLGYKEMYHINFIPTVCIPSRKLFLMGEAGKLNLIGKKIETEGTEISISLDQTPEIKYTGIFTINGIAPENGNYIMGRDDCTELNGVQGQLVVNDVCLPPCYNCNERMSEGDIKQGIDSIESRLLELEGP